MKRLVSLLGLLLAIAITTVNAQVFHVVKVQGSITNLTSGKSIKPGDVVHAKDRIAFESVSANMVAIGDNRTKYVIRMPKTGTVDKTSLVVMAGEAATAVKSRNAFKSRSFNPDQKEVADLKQYFGNERFSIIGNQVNVTLSEKIYPLSPDKFIVFYYNVKDKPISKRLKYDQQTIIIESDKLKEVRGEMITASEIEDVKVYQYEPLSKNSEEITSFNLLFVDATALTTEFNTIIPILRNQKMDDKGIKEYLVDYYVDFYGFTDSKALSAFIDGVLKKQA